MKEGKFSSISKAESLEKMGEFWDTHDFTDFDNQEASDVECQISSTLSVSMRIPGLNKGRYFMADDFDEPLPDSFWLGEE